MPFESGDLFLITPKDYHSFGLEQTCEFMVIRFAPSYVKSYSWQTIDHIECLLYYASHFSSSILVNKDDRLLVHSLMQNLKHAVDQESIYNEDLMRHLVNAVIVVSARNISMTKPQHISSNSDARILQIIDHIQENIRNPKYLKIALIAEKFGMSASYMGDFFRKQCNESMQEYISSYRIRLIEHRLHFSDSRVREIADEFGFADESHINKFFKRHTGMSLSKFRKSLQGVK